MQRHSCSVFHRLSAPLNLSLPLYTFRLDPRLSPPVSVWVKAPLGKRGALTVSPNTLLALLGPDTSRCIFRTVLLTVSYIRIYNVYIRVYTSVDAHLSVSGTRAYRSGKQGKTTASLTPAMIQRWRGGGGVLLSRSREPRETLIHTRSLDWIV